MHRFIQSVRRASSIAYAVLIPSLLLARFAAPAAGQPVGSEFQINTYTGTSYPAVASAADGTFVVVWVSNRDGDGGLLGQRFDGSGQALGTEFQVNDYTLGYQGRQSVASGADGAFVAVWMSDHDGEPSGIFGRRYDSMGQPVGSDFQVNEATTGSQGYPGVAIAANGAFVIVWQDDSERDGHGPGLFGQRYDSAGQRTGTEFQVNSYTVGGQYESAVASAADGAFVVAWTDERDGDGLSVFGRRFDSMGQPVGEDFQINTYTVEHQLYPAVAIGGNGTVVVTWAGEGNQDGDNSGIFAQRYDGAGQKLGAEFQVNSYTEGRQRYPVGVAASANGAFIVTWDSEDGSGQGVFGQSFDAAGQRVGSEFQANTHIIDWQYNAAVAAAADGSFVVVWSSDSQAGNTFGQRFAAPGGCGNAMLDGGEECDDGNLVNGDGCDENCTSTACGNGIVTAGEECDDGDVLDGDGCSSTCEDSAPPENAAADLAPGQTLSSDDEADGATAEDPVETAITLSTGTAAAMVGTVSAMIAETTGVGPSVAGYSFFAQQVQIDIDCTSPPCASPEAPLTLAFRIDATRVPAGVDENGFAVFRDGVIVPACTGDPGTASPDPCVDERQLFGDGDIGVTILTSQASEWSFAKSDCAPTPLLCGDPGKAIFQVKKTTGDPGDTKLLWKWLKGTIGDASAFGDPTVGTSYQLCVYDGAALVESHGIAAAGECAGTPCWKTVGTKGFKYKNPLGNEDGITKVLLKSGDGKAKVLVKGKGAGVVVPDTDPMYTQASSLTVQLVSSGGSCWQAVYAAPATDSTGEKFKDKTT